MQSQDPQKQRAAGGSDAADRLNTIRLRARELNKLLDQLDESGGGAAHQPRREFVRWPFRHATLTLRIAHPGGTAGNLTVACRNISRGGMSVLHRSYLHSGTKCAVALPRPGRAPLLVEGCVVRCGHRGGVIHEIGIRFARPIDVRSLVRPAPFTECFMIDRLEPEALAGTIVCVDPSDNDQTAVRSFVRPTQLRVRPARSIEEALPLILAGCDLVLSEFSLPDGTAAELLGLLRQGGHETPLVVATADTGPAMRQRLAELDIAAALAKPLDESLLLRTVAEFVRSREAGSEPARCGHLATVSLHALRQYSTKLNAAIEQRDPEACGTLCGQILGIALAAGQPAIVALTRKAADALLRTQSVERSIGDLGAVAAACRRAGLSAAA